MAAAYNAFVIADATDAGARRTLRVFGEMKKAGEPIACLTAYDASFARAAERAGADLVLVGDSLGTVVQGRRTTIAVTTDDIAYHCRCAGRGLARAMLAADLPFMSCLSPLQALDRAKRLMQRGGAQMVKLEVAEGAPAIIAALAGQGVAVCAHVGLKPQSVHKLGGLRRQAEAPAEADALVRQARECVAHGADMVLAEYVPDALGRRLARELEAPVIGIGAGPDCDGQILVMHDVLGVNDHPPKFARDFLRGAASVEEAFADYVRAVKSRDFPRRAAS